MTRTTTTKAMHFVRISGRKRPATSGNKNISFGAKRQGDQMGRVRPLFRRTRTAATMR